MEILFWILFGLVAYTYAGYALLLFILVQIKRTFCRKKPAPDFAENDLPEVCLFVTAYNESAYVDQKMQNSRALNYPKEKLRLLWVTDGSDDGSPEMLRRYEGVEVLHQPERRGKMHAMNRGMQFVQSPIVVFCDSNTLLGVDSIREIVRALADPKVGCVAGEKRIIEGESADAAAAGESTYWKFESWIKRMDSELNSAVGAVGELFAVRRELFREVEEDTLLDDFIISLRIAQQGYKIAYVPQAYAMETASVSVGEEMKRKIRIAAGGVQTISRLKSLLNPFRYGLLSLQYISHKVLRWTLAPLALFVLFIVNLFLVPISGSIFPLSFYTIFFFLQFFLYLLAMLGFFFGHRPIRWKIAFVPYYFTSMNVAALLGWLRYLKGKQSVKWEKSKRA